MIKISDIKSYNDQKYLCDERKIFLFNENEKILKNDDFIMSDTVFGEHKREVIKQTIISGLNQAITSYSRNTNGEFYLPQLSEEDWDQALSNISMLAFVQGMPVGLKTYNNYAIATSTCNREYVSPDSIYINCFKKEGKTQTEDQFYHYPGCKDLEDLECVDDKNWPIKYYLNTGYLNTDYKMKSYRANDGEIKYYYPHNQKACYNCVGNGHVDPNENEKNRVSSNRAQFLALLRERYLSHDFYNYEKKITDLSP